MFSLFEFYLSDKIAKGIATEILFYFLLFKNKKDCSE